LKNVRESSHSNVSRNHYDRYEKLPRPDGKRLDFFVNTDGLRILTRQWPATTKNARHAGVLLVHGAAEHSGRYAEFAQSLTTSGLAVFALDLIGHGGSDGDRCFINRSYEDYLEDVDQWIRMTQTNHPEIKNWFLFGHSFGGKLALLSASRPNLPKNIRGLILSVRGGEEEKEEERKKGRREEKSKKD
jgi:acylglycerol lipase